MRVLVVNAGSSSLKVSLLGRDDRLLADSVLDAPTGEPDVGALASFIADLPGIDAVGHRVVHGGERFREAVLITKEVEGDLRALSDLAPLHQAKSLSALDAVSQILPSVPAVACFDTAFHTTMPPPAFTYALPAEWRQRWALRRYGFHGLSHAYASTRAAELLGSEPVRIVTCHLGAGASLAAVLNGRSVDTTMGFTPLEGLVMATRSGSVDPGLVLWLLEHTGLEERDLAGALEHQSGLVGLAGTADMRDVLAGRERGDPPASLAFDVYIHRLRAAIAAMAAAMGGLDALVFTGGVGERSPAVREEACLGLGFLGVELDTKANSAGSDDRRVSTSQAPTPVLVVRAREDLEIARQVRAVLGPATR